MKYQAKDNDWQLLFEVLEESKRESTRHHDALNAARIYVASPDDRTPEETMRLANAFLDKVNGERLDG